MRRRILRFALCGLLTLVLPLLGLSACKGSVEVSDIPGTEPAPETEDADSSAAIYVVWPELDGFTQRTDNLTMATYNAEDNPNMGVIAMVAMSGQEVEPEAFNNGWNAEAETFLSGSGMLPGEVLSHETVSLPLMNQNGIGLTLDIQGVHMQVLYFVAQDQLIQVQGYSLPEDKGLIQTACEQFASRVSLV